LAALLASAQPEIRQSGVRGAGSGAAGKLARGSAFLVFGKNLGPEEVVTGEAPYGKELSGVKVTLKGADGGEVQAYVTRAGAARVEGILPVDTKEGEYELAVSYQDRTSKGVKVNVVERNPGFVTIDRVAGGFVVGSSRQPEGEWTAVGLLAPARPGSEVQLEAAGLGPAGGADNEAGPEQNLVEGAVLVLNGRVEVPVSYAGRNPAKAGYDLIRATLPAEDLPTGCGVSLQLKIGESVSGRVLLPSAAADAEACPNELGLSVERLRQLQEGGSWTTGSLSLTQLKTDISGFLPDIPGLPPLATIQTVEAFTAGFQKMTLGGAALSFRHEESEVIIKERKGCILFKTDEDVEEDAEVTPLDAGETLTLTGPNGMNRAVKRDPETGSYTDQMTMPGGGSIPGLPGPAAPDKIVAGTYKVKGGGGADIGPFEVEQTIPSTVTWTNRADLKSVDRAAGMKFLWTGGSADDMVYGLGAASGPAPEDASRTVQRVFICVAPANAGVIEVPTEILSQMPATAGGKVDELGWLSLQYTTGVERGRFKAPLTAGGEIDAGYFNWVLGTTKPGVRFQ
jgi:uncharacterized protein (TIGR03437 family)